MQGSVLVVEDDLTLREALCDTLKLAGYPVLAAEDGRDAMKVMDQQQIGVVVSDVQMEHMNGFDLLKQLKSRQPDLPVVLMTAYGTIQKAVSAMREGASDYLVKPFDAGVLIEMVERLLVMAPQGTDDELVAEDAHTRELVALSRRVAVSDATVLITGESGSGKEVFARYIHRHSECSEGPFVAINCAAIPENMLEAVIFGYEKGAFTGASQANPGKFEQANGGTLLLDEISEMDLGLQAKLLRVLQEREVERLGGRKMIPLNVRVLATSNRNLREEVMAGRFREDLFYRLNVFPLHIAPLQVRADDILPLANRMIERWCVQRSPKPRLSKAAQRKLRDYMWPGNVRELDNVIQRALILQHGEEIGGGDICFESHHGEISQAPLRQDDNPQVVSITPREPESVAQQPDEDLKTREQRLIIEVLKTVNGSRKETAERLGISPRTLRYKLARLRDAGWDIPA
jgi:two-component system response regulator FlrC